MAVRLYQSRISATATLAVTDACSPAAPRAARGFASASSSKAPFLPREVYIASAVRTPIGAFCGSLSGVSAPKLGASAIRAALRRARVDANEVESVILGQALPAGCGQNAARQAALAADIPITVDCFGVNKACASGLKAIMLAAQSIALGECELAVAGGMESMSRAPYMLRKARQGGYHYGHGAMEDAALLDGLTDAASQSHLGSCVEGTVRAMGITREEMDAYTIESYRRAAAAWQRGVMDGIVSPLRVRGNPQRDGIAAKSKLVSYDEEYSRLQIDTVAQLPPLFEEDGIITAASASSLNDGACAVVLISGERARELGVGAIAKIRSFADFAVEPSEFVAAPTGAVRKALRSAGLGAVDFHEIHEAYAAAALVNMRHLGLDHSRVNVNGGACALGHPLGASGANIVSSLLGVLQQRDALTGCASIANGGGGASAIVVERLVA